MRGKLADRIREINKLPNEKQKEAVQSLENEFGTDLTKQFIITFGNQSLRWSLGLRKSYKRSKL